jgi:hypothetical protein
MLKINVFTCLFVSVGFSVLHTNAAGYALHTELTPQAIGVRDSMFSRPYIDVEEWRNEPIRHL